MRVPDQVAMAINEILKDEHNDFLGLVAKSNLDPASDFRSADLSGSDLSRCDLSHFDFAEADLRACDLTKTRLPSGIAVEQINGSVLNDTWIGDQPMRPEDLPNLGSFQEAEFAPEMVVIPAGRFLMGSPEDEERRRDNEGPQHEVTIDYRFAVGRYVVTFDEFDMFCSLTGRTGSNDEGWGRDRNPLIYASWEDAQAYLNWLNLNLTRAFSSPPYRLLSEAEWEYCCRAGSEKPFSFGEKISKDQVNHGGVLTLTGVQGNSYPTRTLPVGTLPANGWGLFEMHGNVWEWVDDTWHNSYEGAPTDGSAWTDGKGMGRVLRGGSWREPIRGVRSASRTGRISGERRFDIGFRVAKTL